ncbi:epoxyqueuosine reductase QueH [Candidatus Latescibacterota bacterium]
MPKLLLHICCGPCATTVIERLSVNYDITGYFFNPNIHPEDEYNRRLEAAHTVADRLGVKLIEGLYDPPVFFDAVRGLEDEPENGTRCPVCYRLRLGGTADAALENSFDTIASTLTVGPMKKARIINPIGEEEAKRSGVRFLGDDWKKKDGFKHSCELSGEFGIYRQHYCGCLFSMRK